MKAKSISQEIFPEAAEAIETEAVVRNIKKATQGSLSDSSEDRRERNEWYCD